MLQIWRNSKKCRLTVIEVIYVFSFHSHPQILTQHVCDRGYFLPTDTKNFEVRQQLLGDAFRIHRSLGDDFFGVAFSPFMK